MNEFDFYTPTEVIFGRKAEEKVGIWMKEHGAEKVLLHYGGGSAERSGLLGRIRFSLEQAGVSYVELGGVHPNPRLGLVRKGIELCKEQSVNFILAVGGGSAIDSSKAIALGVANPDHDIWDFYTSKAVPQKHIPVAAVLTIAAAGSEMSDCSIITKEEGLEKKGCNSNLNFPAAAFMNPELLYTLPKYQMAAGITDIMMHTMERYFTAYDGGEMSSLIAEAVLKNVVHFGTIILDDPKNYEAASEIMWAGTLSHNGLTGLGCPGDWATHQLGHELSAMFDVTHGASLSAVWGAWARSACAKRPERFVRFAKQIWNIEDQGSTEETVSKGITCTEKYFESLGMPTTIPMLIGRQLTEEELNLLSWKCTYKGERTIGKLWEMGEPEIKEVYIKANC